MTKRKDILYLQTAERHRYQKGFFIFLVVLLRDFKIRIFHEAPFCEGTLNQNACLSCFQMSPDTRVVSEFEEGSYLKSDTREVQKCNRSCKECSGAG